jgi:hypothetical protein
VPAILFVDGVAWCARQTIYAKFQSFAVKIDAQCRHVGNKVLFPMTRSFASVVKLEVSNSTMQQYHRVFRSYSGNLSYVPARAPELILKTKLHPRSQGTMHPAKSKDGEAVSWSTGS